MNYRHFRPFRDKAHLIALPGILSVGMLVSPGLYLAAGCVLTAVVLVGVVGVVGLVAMSNAEI